MRNGFLTACGLAVVLWSAPAAANQLLQIYGEARANAAQFDAARAAYQAGLEAWPQARAAILPSLSATASYASVEREVEETAFAGGPRGPSAPLTDDFNAVTYGVELRQPLFNWAIPATLSQGRARADIAKLEFLDAKQSLVGRVLDGYVDFLRAQAALRLTRAEKAAIAADLKRARGRYEVGAIAITGLRQAQAALDLAQSRIISARARLDRKRETLRRLTTHWYESLPGVPKNFDPQMPAMGPMKRWVQRAFRYNPEYLVALRKANIAEEQIQQQRADFIPTVDLVASYQATDNTDFVYGGANNSATIALEARWLLFAGGRNLSEVRQAKARYAKAMAKVEAVRRQIASATRNAYRQVKTELRRLEALEQAIQSARIAYKSVRAQFRLGERNQSDVIDARRDLYSAIIKRAQARYDFVSALTQLRLAAGVLSVEDLKRIDSLLVPPGTAPRQPVPVPE